jgi:hypothetical protein
MVMQEVQRQLGPLAEQVGKLTLNSERLFNTNGGPPGFLQSARSEDKKTFQQIFKTLDEHKEDIKPLKDFLKEHSIREEEREKERREQAEALAKTVKEADRKFKRYIAYWTIALAGFMAILAIYDHRDIVIHSLLAPPAAHSQLAPQNATIPTNP